jgi:glycosyltransferase involved in cell wall biosynthesis
VILAVGNFNERRKGIRPLVKAFSLMRSEGRNVRLRVSGTVDAALREELTSSVPAAVAAHIQFLGLGRPEDLPMLYQSASVLALPAMWEPSGTVMMEAWLSGTPVVAPRHGGLPEFFAAGTGFLFDPLTTGEETPNVEGMAEALDNANALAGLATTRARCREHGETFSPEAVGPRFTEIYRQITNGNGG